MFFPDAVGEGALIKVAFPAVDVLVVVLLAPTFLLLGLLVWSARRGVLLHQVLLMGEVARLVGRCGAQGPC